MQHTIQVFDVYAEKVLNLTVIYFSEESEIRFESETHEATFYNLGVFKILDAMN